MEIEVTIHGLMPASNADHQILVLKPRTDFDGKFIPIWIGETEASSIRLALEETTTARPLTHDLLKTMLSYFKTPLQKVVIYKMVQGTFFANLHLDNRGTEISIDARPSDAISLALRLKAPVFINEDVYLKQQVRIKENQEIEKINLEG
ncbi:MAG: bifunctional nuclease family protein [Nitrospirae bacterium]|nr:bifunctional nuclease family protein [Nitrospirota bacterium]MBI3352097.1 bifunctional nuclease family protein [Nitrospirota bacterium]